jgi:ADP-ribose pyrophosphatase YjhB (NUDIX family)
VIQRARGALAGPVSLPGGRLEAGETAEQCAIRSARETGLSIYALRPLMRMGWERHEFPAAGVRDGGFEVRSWHPARSAAIAGCAPGRSGPGDDAAPGRILEQAFRLFDRS